MSSIITRRDLLTGGLGLVGLGAALPNYLVRSALAAAGTPRRSDRIVVSILLTGGPDGLSLVPPHGHKEYYDVRPKLAYRDAEVIKLNDQVGLHPRLTGFKRLLDEGKMALVQGTAYPNYNLSHFTARDYWEAANSTDISGKAGAAGWLGRYLDQACCDQKGKILNVAVGAMRFPLTITSKVHSGIGFEKPESFRFEGLLTQRGREQYLKLNKGGKADAPAMPGAPPPADLPFVTQTALSANEASDLISRIAGDYKTPVRYPDTEFGSSIRAIAALINGGMPTRVYSAAQGMAVFGGYDTHADQIRRLDQLLGELNDTIVAFQADLARTGNDKRVLTYTFSEFGRRVAENYSGGTDHGLAQPMFLFGPGVKAGVHGKLPSLTDLDQGNLKMQVDFRGVYRTVLEKWLGVPAQPVLDKEYAPVDCMA
jgi:uncharacterized protein (DUF1501 family)